METPWNPILERGSKAVLLVRHGRTALNAQRRFIGRTDVGLDDLGRREVQALRRTWGVSPTRVYSSPLARARETASLLHADVQLVEGLEELDQGALEGLTGPEAMSLYPEFFEEWARDPSHVRVPGGETLSELRARVTPVLLRLAKEAGRGPIVVVSHQLVMAVATCWVLEWPLTRWRACKVRNAAITVLGWDGESFEVAATDWRPAGYRVAEGGV